MPGAVNAGSWPCEPRVYKDPWVIYQTWQLYLMLSLSSVSLLNIKVKKLKSCRDILNMKAIQMTPSTWDHNHEHFRKGCLTALCICYFYGHWHLRVSREKNGKFHFNSGEHLPFSYSVKLLASLSTYLRYQTRRTSTCVKEMMGCTYLYVHLLESEPICTSSEFSWLL